MVIWSELASKNAFSCKEYEPNSNWLKQQGQILNHMSKKIKR